MGFGETGNRGQFFIIQQHLDTVFSGIFFPGAVRPTPASDPRTIRGEHRTIGTQNISTWYICRFHCGGELFELTNKPSLSMWVIIR